MRLFLLLLVVSALSCDPQRILSQTITFPTREFQVAAPEELGWQRDHLEQALDFAMDCKSSSVVVVVGGKIIAQRHQPVVEPSLRYRMMVVGKNEKGHVVEDVASVQKSVVSLLVGIAVDRGLVTIDDPVSKHLGEGWSQANPQQEAEIQLRHLITMTSGLNPRLRSIAPAGSRWSYNTNAYAKSLLCLERASGQSANQITEKWLTNRLGMADSRWIDRARAGEADEDANRVGFATTALDLARIGLLVLAGGNWEGEPVIADQRYLKDAFSPSQPLNASYGYLWWLNGQSHAVRAGRKVDGPLNAAAPPDMVAALGALGRKCYVVPSLNLVVTRLGDTPDRARSPSFDNEFWRRIMRAAPQDRNAR